jgi:hypothetical protein
LVPIEKTFQQMVDNSLEHFFKQRRHLMKLNKNEQPLNSGSSSSLVNVFAKIRDMVGYVMQNAPLCLFENSKCDDLKNRLGEDFFKNVTALSVWN